MIAFVRARLSTMLLALGACGRFGFEGTPGGDGGNSEDGFVAPCTGADEDGDLWPDACDRCPTEPSSDQSDSDGDGIGDVCDPRPANPNDTILFFDPFETLDARYTMFGTYSIVSGALRLGTIVDAGQAFFNVPPAVTRIDFAYRPIVHSTTIVTWMGVWSEIDQGADTKIFSETAWDPAVPAETVSRIKESDNGTDRYSVNVVTPGTWATGQRYRTITDSDLVTGGPYRSQVSIPGQAQRLTELTLQIARGTEGFIESEAVIVDVEYLIVYVDSP